MDGDAALLKAFGLMLQARRKQVGLSQGKLAVDADVNRSYIAKLELGKNRPTLSVMHRLALALNDDLVWMVRETLQRFRMEQFSRSHDRIDPRNRHDFFTWWDGQASNPIAIYCDRSAEKIQLSDAILVASKKDGKWLVVCRDQVNPNADYAVPVARAMASPKAVIDWIGRLGEEDWFNGRDFVEFFASLRKRAHLFDALDTR